MFQQRPRARSVRLAFALGDVPQIARSIRALLLPMMLWRGPKEAQLVAMLQVILLCADCTGRLAPGNLLAAREEVCLLYTSPSPRDS